MGYRNVFLVSDAKITVKNDQLVLAADCKRTIPLEDLNAVVVDNLQTVFSSYALSELAKYGVTVIFTDKSHLPNAVLQPLGSYCRQLQVLKCQIDTSVVTYKQIWKRITSQKIINQALALKYAGIDEWESVYRLAAMVKSGDSDNIEAIAAQKYFTLMFGKGFRRGSDCLINSQLNYGYAILRSAIAKQLCVCGFEPCLGIFHHNELNNFNLADDLIEPFRPVVDLFVKHNTADRDDDDELTPNDKAQLVNLLNVDVIYSGKEYAVSYAIEIMINKLTLCLKNNSADIILPEIIPLKNHCYE